MEGREYWSNQVYCSPHVFLGLLKWTAYEFKKYYKEKKEEMQSCIFENIITV